MTPKNIPEFIDLIKRYESITIEEIEEAFDIYHFVTAGKLTGFGRTRTCTLCLAIDGDCKKCAYWQINNDSINANCASGPMEKTYTLISIAQNPLELLSAYRARAVVMREYAKTIGIEII